MTEYNGHPSWTAWSVAHELSNDYNLYQEAVRLGEKYGADQASKMLINELPMKTSDGARYSLRTIKWAIEGLISEKVQ